jgi:hypothetical protein
VPIALGTAGAAIKHAFHALVDDRGLRFRV